MILAVPRFVTLRIGAGVPSVGGYFGSLHPFSSLPWDRVGLNNQSVPATESAGFRMFARTPRRVVGCANVSGIAPCILDGILDGLARFDLSFGFGTAGTGATLPLTTRLCATALRPSATCSLITSCHYVCLPRGVAFCGRAELYHTN